MIQVLIQVAAGSCDRKIYNEKTLEYLETRPGSQPYPYPYGFVVGTSAEDGDCVDCYLITSDKVLAGNIVECKPVGLLLQDEAGEIDQSINNKPLPYIIITILSGACWQKRPGWYSRWHWLGSCLSGSWFFVAVPAE